jgi:hypothetical protein
MEDSSLRLLMESENGGVWHSEDGDYFWVRFGNVRWRMDVECIGPYKGYLRSIHAFLEKDGRTSQPAHIRTKDPALFLALTPEEIEELVCLLDIAETIATIENDPA